LRDWPWPKLLAVVDNHDRAIRATNLELDELQVLQPELTIWPMESDWLTV
jgi:hypothetical protein